MTTGQQQRDGVQRRKGRMNGWEGGLKKQEDEKEEEKDEDADER